ncbi:FecR domain-containing protein [Stenomitos frigidus]|uniref:Uncharacterized protein n=1 Tax=Stenomitos frigidus ULC18 TaxID=2107698 RepID=A0A2T1E292_9CYAN|nr:FecR domain-containing protein [Stenomitos frigidus]PSB26866.1 hypothetical protein C7B82_18655 [Stenomitos frigidus ULC18]
MLIRSKWLSANSTLSRLLLIFVCALCVVLLSRSPISAQVPTINQAKITQVLDSSQIFIQNRQAKLNDSASKGQRVRTGKARAQLTFNTGAIGRLAHNSVLTVGQCARLQQGTLLVNGAMNGCTASVVAGVRGTTYVIEATETGETGIKVLEGEVTVTRQQEEECETEPASGSKQFSLPSIIPSLPTPEPEPAQSPTPEPPAATERPPANVDEVVLKAGEKVSISPTEGVGLVEKLTQSDFTNLLQGNLFNGFTLSLPGMAKIQASFQQLFPGVTFPIRLPSVSIPGLPIRLPF